MFNKDTNQAPKGSMDNNEALIGIQNLFPHPRKHKCLPKLVRSKFQRVHLRLLRSKVPRNNNKIRKIQGRVPRC
jgi:hypothetical protein